MNSFEQMQAKFNFDRIKAGKTPDSMGPEAWASGKSIGPEYVDKREEVLGNKSPVMKAIRKDNPDEHGDELVGLNNIRDQVQKQEDKVQVTLRVDKDQLAKDMQAAFTDITAGPFGDLIVTSMKNYVEQKLRELEAKIKLMLTG